MKNNQKAGVRLPATTAAGRWSMLDSRRQEVLNRAELAARVTIPSLFVREGHTENSKLPTPYQGLGARAVNKLASKLLLALFPPNTRFFKLGLSEQVRQALKRRRRNIAEVEGRLGELEGIVVESLERSRLRPVASTMLKHLLVTGNYLLQIGKGLTFRGYNLRSFVVNRDPEGNVLEAITREVVSPETLSEDVRNACSVKTDGVDKTVDVYTRQWRDDNKFRVVQEINGVIVPGSEGEYPLDAPLFLPLRWTAVHGEDYGRGMVDEYIGDFNALDDLSRDLLKASAAAAKIVFFRNPSAYFTRKQLATARSGDVLDGKKEDVGVAQLEKFADFRITLERVRDLTDQLSKAFLMSETVQRDAERVTAEEVRYMAQELEDALGGVYSILAAELQVPLLNRTMKVLAQRGALPQLSNQDINLTITTGLEALGRGHDLNKVVQFTRLLKEVFGEEQATLRLNTQWVIEKIASSMGIDAKEAVASEEDVAAELNRRQMASLAEKVAPGVAQEATKAQVNNNG